jgi:N-acetylglutamate synthase-like GNAT family acetyltransferase
MSVKIYKTCNVDLDAVLEIVTRLWGDTLIIVHGDVFNIADLPGLKAVIENQIAGILHYQISDQDCEILTLASLIEGQGIGSTLLAAIEELAQTAGCKKLCLITTNDNLHALGFFQRRGFHLVALYPGQVARSREIKPHIPLVGDQNIPIRDELKLEKPI